MRLNIFNKEPSIIYLGVLFSFRRENYFCSTIWSNVSQGHALKEGQKIDCQRNLLQINFNTL